MEIGLKHQVVSQLEWFQYILGGFPNSVKYKKLNNGYELDLINGWMKKSEDIKHLDSFWKGLVKSNLKKTNLYKYLKHFFCHYTIRLKSLD